MIVFSKVENRSKKPLLWMPISNDLSDYAPMVARLIRTVAEEADKSEIQIIDDLETVAIGDIIRIRSFDPLDQIPRRITIERNHNEQTNFECQ
jgi:hypothetical protein